MRIIPCYYFNDSYIFTQKVFYKDDVMHGHTFFEIFYIVKGNISHTVNNTTETLHAGDIFCLRPNDIHCFNREKGNMCEHRDILISIEGFKKICDFIDKSLYDYIFNLPSPPHFFLQNYIIDELEQDCTVFKTNNTVNNSIYLGNYFSTKIVNIVFKELFIKSTLYPEWITKTIKKFETPQNYSMTLADLLSDIHYNRAYISRVFKHYTNTTLVEYFLNCKLNYAMLRLINTNDLITAIASKSGFDSIQYFNKAFKNRFGQSPSAIRKKSHLPTPRKA